MRVGLVGYGSIAKRLISLLNTRDAVELVGVLVRDSAKVRIEALPLCSSADDLIAARPEVVVEVGGHEALRRHGPPVLQAGIDLVLVSVGALADPASERAIIESARAGNSRATVASGAIGGLDALAAAAVGGLQRVTHVTRKPPRSLLEPAPAARLTTPQEVFRGSAREGALLFPESINVAAAVSLAGIGFDRTEVCVIADPGVTRNVHQVLAEGEFGELRVEIYNVPSEENPRTASLVAMSIVHCLRRRRASLLVG